MYVSDDQDSRQLALAQMLGIIRHLKSKAGPGEYKALQKTLNIYERCQVSAPTSCLKTIDQCLQVEQAWLEGYQLDQDDLYQAGSTGNTDEDSIMLRYAEVAADAAEDIRSLYQIPEPSISGPDGYVSVHRARRHGTFVAADDEFYDSGLGSDNDDGEVWEESDVTDSETETDGINADPFQYDGEVYF